jgi:hypothetical protein
MKTALIYNNLIKNILDMKSALIYNNLINLIRHIQCMETKLYMETDITYISRTYTLNNLIKISEHSCVIVDAFVGLTLIKLDGQNALILFLLFLLGLNL